MVACLSGPALIGNPFMSLARCNGMSDHNTDKSAPVPVEMPMSQAKDGKVPDKVVPDPADDPAIATLADSVHANA